MRIPSQFNQDSLYRRENRHRVSRDSYRRLIRLGIGLALVILVMRQAAKPAFYQSFFDPTSSAQPSPLEAGVQPIPPSKSSEANSSHADLLTGGHRPVAAIDPEDRNIAHEILAELLQSDQRHWVVALSRWRRGQPVSWIPSSIESVRTALSALDGISETRRSQWQHTLQSFESSVPSSSMPEEADLPRVDALLAVLDSAANARVEDGSVWRSGDFDSLYRFLDQAQQMPRSGIAFTSVLPLLQQPEVFRNQWVRVSGSVARVSRIEAEDNHYGIGHYWQLWLRPNGGVDRPIVAIVPEMPAAWAATGVESGSLNGAEIEVTGKFLKRLAYESGLGADLAPVVVGQITLAPISEQQRMMRAAATDESHSIWLPIVLACLFGVLSATFVMWRTSVAGKRSRVLRSSRLAPPNLFLAELDDRLKPLAPSEEDP